MLRLTPCASLLALLAASASALQDPDGLAPTPRPSFALSPMVLRRAEPPLAVGPGYKAVFHAGRVEVVPALGREAPRSLPLGLALESIALGDVVLHAADSTAAPEASEPRVVYVRGPAITEVYEPRADGLEQSFVFHALPDAPGDLVVRLRVDTELVSDALGESASGFRFTRGQRGLAVGAVTGIDAHGAQRAGTLRFDGAVLSLVLPEAFVRAAALPLVLDPLISPAFYVGSEASDSGDPDAAFDPATGSYLVVWESYWSGSDVDVYGQRISASGAALGLILPVEPGISPISMNPTVASAPGGSRYLVAWQQGPGPLGPFEVWARTVEASSGALGPSGRISEAGKHSIDPDAGTLGPGEDSAALVWQEQGDGIRWARVTWPSGVPGASIQAQVRACVDCARPKIARNGAGLRALVVWEELVGTQSDVWARAVTPSGSMTNLVAVAATTLDESHPDVDGDGANWLVAYESDPSGSAQTDIHSRKVSYTGSPTLVMGIPKTVEASAGQVEAAPAVAYAGPKYLVAFEDVNGLLDRDVVGVGINPKLFEVCEPHHTLLAGAEYSGEVALAARVSASPSAGDEVLAVWQQALPAFPASGEVLGAFWEAIGPGGSVVNVGGGCAGGGAITTAGAVSVGNPALAINLTGASGAATLALLNIALAPVPSACGSCTFNLPAILLSTGMAGGAASISIPVPCDAALSGAVFQAQWAVLPTGLAPCPTFPGVSFSDRLSMAVGF